MFHTSLLVLPRKKLRANSENKIKLWRKGATPVQASAVRKQDRLTQKLWLWLRQLGGGLSKHKWAVDKGGGGGGRLSGLLKYGGGGSCWEERPRLNGIQYGTQPVTCKHGDRGRGKTTAYTRVWGFQKRGGEVRVIHCEFFLSMIQSSPYHNRCAEWEELIQLSVVLKVKAVLVFFVDIIKWWATETLLDDGKTKGEQLQELSGCLILMLKDRRLWVFGKNWKTIELRLQYDRTTTTIKHSK